MINTSFQKCPFCSTPIDRPAAKQSTATTGRISQACSDARFLKIMLGILIPFALSIFFALLGVAGLLGVAFIKYAILIMIIRWWLKYGRIETTNSGYRRARVTVILASAISFLVLLFLRVNILGLRL
jgi:hypothetical protein